MGVPRRICPDETRTSGSSPTFSTRLFPVAPRVEGLISDDFVLDPEIDNYPLESLAVPTMFVHARDDLLVSYDLAVRAAERVSAAPSLSPWSEVDT